MKTSAKDYSRPRNEPSKLLMINEHQHIAIKDIAGYCMVSTSTVRRWMKDGKLKSIKLPSNQCRVRIADFKDFLERYNIPVGESLFR
jgi:excisionase family DNA binding protein